jgi:peptidoglycan/xylan/chitin deacetylase (PgdA/CDA1 family)
MRRHKLGIMAAVAVLLALAWFWPVGEGPARSLIATEPTASGGEPRASASGDEAATTAPSAEPGTSGPEPSATPSATSAVAPPSPEATAPAAEPVAAYGGPLGTRNRTGSDAVGLTFDDGPSPQWTPQVLDLLRRHGVKATFCVIGAYAEAYPELIADIAREGHTLCSHTWFHEYDLGRWDEEEIRANLRRTNEAIRKAAPGAQVPYFRHPGGQWTDRAVAVAADLGMESLHWTVDPSDWDKAASEAQIREHVLDRTGPGAIVLLHDGGADQQDTVGALRSVLAEFDRRGYACTAM